MTFGDCSEGYFCPNIDTGTYTNDLPDASGTWATSGNQCPIHEMCIFGTDYLDINQDDGAGGGTGPLDVITGN